MNLSATLLPDEIDNLANHERPLRDAGLSFAQQTLDNQDRTETSFELGLRLKNTLDALEGGCVIEPNDRAVALFINCEYWLWRLYMDEPSIKHNPFLSHWVEAIQRLDTKGKQKQDATEDLSPSNITAARVLWMKTLLQQSNLYSWWSYTPAEAYEELMKEGLPKPFDIQPFVQILEDEGIFDKTSDVEAVASSSKSLAANGQHDNANPKSETTEPSPEETLQKEKAVILSKLRTQPDAAIFDITRLPIAIPYLDFLTTLLANRTFEKYKIDPRPIVTQYIQHALRTVEASEKPPSPSLEAETTGDGHREEAEYGKDAQARYIRLLLLFIKSLIRKGLVELDVLYYEIAEITVRYVWIKEVREFRTWAEEGIGWDGAAG